MLDNKTFQSQFATTTLSGISEPLYILKGTGACYLNIKAISRLIDKEAVYVRRYVKTLLESGKESGVLEAEIPTNGGVQVGRLLPEDVIIDIVAKYKPALLLAFGQFGLRSWLYEQAGYTKSETPTKDISSKIADLISLRNLAKEHHMMFQMRCQMNGIPAHKAHDELTKLINGNTAEDNRYIDALIGDGFEDITIGINHVLDERFHFILAMSKKHFANSKHKTDWKNELVRAYQKAVKEYNKL